MISVLLYSALILIPAAAANDTSPTDEERKSQYVSGVTQGEGLMPWQKPGVSKAETDFREWIEATKEKTLAARVPVTHPVMLTSEDLKRAQRNIEVNDWASAWFKGKRSLAERIAAQPEEYVREMISELTPTHEYGFTCPNCVGRKSQEALGSSLVKWTADRPDEIICARCGQVYPDADYPETAKLVCPRTNQSFTYYRNDAERENPKDRTGKLAYHWVGHPIHVSFSGVIRGRKVRYMIRGLDALATTYALKGETRYAERAVAILERLAHVYRNWLYHDYWDTIADCDPMYAAWHDRELPLEWKRHLCAEVFAKDTLTRARMMQSYWGGGRLHPSTDSIGALHGVCLAYDLVHDAKDSDGVSLWTPERRAKVERDLILEWEMGAEFYVGGHGKADSPNNKAPRIYRAQAAVAKSLGLPTLADTALRGYETVRDRSFLYDGFSRESPSYTNMYLGTLVEIPEILHGFRWPKDFAPRRGVLDLYKTDPQLRMMYSAVLDQLLPGGYYAPLSDSNLEASPSAHILEIGLNRYPETYGSKLPLPLRKRLRREYSIFHTQTGERPSNEIVSPPEIYFPAWMNAFLRHGDGSKASLLSLTFNPHGGHRHYDNLALFYMDRGTSILGDHGYVGDMPVNAWIKSTFSHNLVVVDDAGQRFAGDTPRKPRLHLMATSPKVSVVEASSDVYKQCSQYRRLVALIKGPGAETFALDIFRVKGGSSHRYRVFSELASSDTEDGKLSFVGASMPSEKPLPEVGNSLERADIFGLRDVRTSTSLSEKVQAIWSEPDRGYRLWLLSEAERLEASNGPGQRTRTESGRRVRYLDAVREGSDLASAFVAIHEPGAPDSGFVVREAKRLVLPSGAGPDAVAVSLRTDWGDYWVFSGFEREAEVEGIRFEGAFGVLCDPSQGETWLWTLGASTLRRGEFGYAGQTPVWTSDVKKSTATEIVASTPRPDDWPTPPSENQVYLVANDGEYVTGFPVAKTSQSRVEVERFPLPEIKEFQLPALRSMR